MKRSIAMVMVLITVIMMLSACASEFVDGNEAGNNNMAEYANKIRLNAHVAGVINPSDDVDWYAFTLPNSAEITLDMSFRTKNPSNMYWTISIYQADGVTVLYHYNRQGNEEASFDLGTLSQNTYYIKVSASVGGDNISYGLRVVKKHDCEGTFSITKAPTCTEAGTEERLCMICGTAIETRVVPATGHTSDLWTVDVAATCTNEGLRHGHCTVCNEDVTEKIEKTEHMLGAWTVVKEATCDGDGYEERTCSHCTYREEQTIAQLHHKFGKWEVVSGNVIIPPMVKEQECELCHYTETVNDWGFVWLTVLAGVALVGICVGVVIYIKVYIS